MLVSAPAFTESFEGWPDRFPSQNLVDAYLVIDQDGSAKKWNQTTYYANYQASGGLASEVLYQHRDKRFGASVVYDSTKLYNNIVMTRDAGNMNRLSSSVGDWGVSESNYYYRKGLYEAKKVWYSDATNYSQAIIRLGEVYLNYAEALLLTGKITEAVTAINQTRQVHGGLPAIETTPSEDEAWDIYKNERRVDLLMENDRYWSLLRWAKFKGQIDIPELRETIRRVDISADGKTFSFADVTLNGNSDRVFTQRRFLFPVPISELQANPKLAPNNEGW
ncbi:MAG: RagB/SusD family nutrient uptake outer membrane protein [Bacteroidota bacterium]